MKGFECRRCGGRGRLGDQKGEPCFLCLGKGVIDFAPEQLEDYFKKKRKPTRDK